MYVQMCVCSFSIQNLKDHFLGFLSSYSRNFSSVHLEADFLLSAVTFKYDKIVHKSYPFKVLYLI